PARGRASQDGDLRLPALLPSALPPIDAHVRTLHIDTRRRRDYLWSPRLDGADGHEKTGRLFVGQPPRVRGARDLRPDRRRDSGERDSNGQSWTLDGSAVPDRRNDLRPP